MTKSKQLSFEGQTIFCGVDVHKTNWKIHTRMNGMDLASFSQNPDAELLATHLRKNYPEAAIHVVYEAGFCGFGLQRSMSRLGIECIVVNPADVPASDKERKRKDDKRDARKLSRELGDGSLKAIYVPTPEMEHARTLVRWRHRLVQDQTRCKNRIRHLLLFSGLQVKDAAERWNLMYMRALQNLVCPTPALRTALDIALEQYRSIREVLRKATLEVRRLSRQEPFTATQQHLQTIDGVGPINGMVIQTELHDIRRFKTLDSLCDYAGFVPDTSSSDEHLVIKGVTKRCNEFLREAIIESSWILIRKDPAMLMKYNEYRRRMNANKAIIRIGKHLLSRIRYVWMHQKPYERGLVG